MNIATLSNYIIPILILIIVLYGLKKKQKVYIDFVDGAKDGFGDSNKSYADFNRVNGGGRNA